MPNLDNDCIQSVAASKRDHCKTGARDSIAILCYAAMELNRGSQVEIAADERFQIS